MYVLQLIRLNTVKGMLGAISELPDLGEDDDICVSTLTGMVLNALDTDFDNQPIRTNDASQLPMRIYEIDEENREPVQIFEVCV